MRRTRVDYEGMKVVFSNKPSDEVVDNYLKRTIDISVKEYGKELVLEALLQIKNEMEGWLYGREIKRKTWETTY